MRDYLVVDINHRRYHLQGDQVFRSLSDFLRRELRLTGTKIVCEEGDCGACTAMAGFVSGDRLRYCTLNTCIQSLYQLDCAHIITIEGLRDEGELTPVQQAMIAYHGSQCGFCTPGFVVSLTDLFERCDSVSDDEVRCALVGNLCRCTGYTAIFEAAAQVDLGVHRRIAERYPIGERLAAFQAVRGTSAQIETGGERPRRLLVPASLEQALLWKRDYPDAVLVAGGTDLGVQINKGRPAPASLMSLAHISELSDLQEENGTLQIGANMTWTRVEQHLRDRVPAFHEILNLFGSPQIKNIGTVGGNLANASPIADSLPFLYAVDAAVELQSMDGARQVPVKEFYAGYKSIDLRPDELIARIHVPLPAPDETLRLYRVSRRRGMDIATLGAGVWMRRAGDQIAAVRIACGGVGPTVLRLAKTEAFLSGRKFTEANLRKAGKLARNEIAPISDVRAGRDYRLQLAENLLIKFYHDVAEPDSSAEVAGVPEGVFEDCSE